jgi:hypothetical protein
MLEHYQMFANSQTNESPYGRHDCGPMIRLRDDLRMMSLGQLLYVSMAGERQVSENYEQVVREAWMHFLGSNIEPTSQGFKAAQVLDKMFGELPDETRRIWAQGFYHCMQTYRSWAEAALRDLDDLTQEQLSLPGITPDVREVI